MRIGIPGGCVALCPRPLGALGEAHDAARVEQVPVPSGVAFNFSSNRANRVIAYCALADVGLVATFPVREGMHAGAGVRGVRVDRERRKAEFYTGEVVRGRAGT